MYRHVNMYYNDAIDERLIIKSYQTSTFYIHKLIIKVIRHKSNPMNLQISSLYIIQNSFSVSNTTYIFLILINIIYFDFLCF